MADLLSALKIINGKGTMKLSIVGRNTEREILKDFLHSDKPEFLAIYGRRRVGKTYLIKQYFSGKSCLFFSATGIQKGSLEDQISRFCKSISRAFYDDLELKEPKDWFAAFDMLVNAIKKVAPKHKKIVLFLDELPWMVTHKSKLLAVLEYFWNEYWSADPRIKLVVCGSSASWIIKKIINDEGGLHNRITRKIQLEPLSLRETKAFLVAQGVKLNNQQIAELYMVTGGIPYYLAPAKKGLSSVQLIEQLAFSKNSILFKEFDNLFASLFKDAQPYIALLRVIEKHRYGISQQKLIQSSQHLSSGGYAIDKLKELEEAGFILSFVPLYKERGTYYRIIDEYTLFYLKWIEPVRKTLQKASLEKGYWESQMHTPAWSSWSGYAFEAICYKHISQIRKKLNISPSAVASSWRYAPKAQSHESGAQIDLLFDRKDKTITLCEIKYSNRPFAIDKKYYKNLLNKQEVFRVVTRTEKQLQTAMVVSSGLKNNLYAEDFINGFATLDDLFTA